MTRWFDSNGQEVVPPTTIVRQIQQRCPICEGRRYVPAGFYTGLAASFNNEICQQCGGTGMLVTTETEVRP